MLGRRRTPSSRQAQRTIEGTSAPEIPPFVPSPPPPPPTRGALLDTVGGRMATWAVRFLLIGAATVVLLWILGKIWDVTLPVVLGLLLATVLWPPTRLLRKVMPAALAALITLLAGIGVMVGLVFVLAPQVTGQWEEVSDSALEGIRELQDLIAEEPFNVSNEQIDDVFDQVLEQAQGNASSIAGGVLTGVSTATSFLITGILALVLCFFFLKDGPKFIPWLSALAGPRAAPHAAEVSRRLWATLSGFIKAQAAVGLVDAIAIGVGLALLGVPFALPLAVLIFFGAFIPIIGAFLTGAIAALVALVTDGPTTALIVVVLIVVVQQLEGNVLQPVLVGRTLDLHAALVILAVTAGGGLAGIVGMFLAVPVLAVSVALLRYGREQLEEATQREKVPEPRGPAVKL
ncbi:AI-2E family transporter [Nocardioides solisilvae]|uniref:AI-2E family transporter n=1 Tax=Nocardioides solisilvae TaxID=1542435 RepID=UPI0013A5398F|nr:AI-2E family transporter [Nocardioides solisilvae]